MTVSAPLSRRRAHHRFGRIEWNRRAVRDAAVVFLIASVAWTASERFDLFAAIMKFQSVYGEWGLDDLAMMLIVLAFALAAFTWRRMQDLTAEAHARSDAEAETKRSLAQLGETQKFLNTIVEHVPASIIVRELPENRFILINREGEKIHGTPRANVLGRAVADVLPPATARVIAEHDREVINSTEAIVFGERKTQVPGKGERITLATGLAIADRAGKPKYIVNVIQDITERRSAEERIAHMAHHDPLTDLPNRAAFNEALQAALARARAAGGRFAVMCIDLDRFKEVNDVFGHAAGDGLLCEVARRLRLVCGNAFVARLGGDEFTIICAEGTQPGASEVLADRLLQAIEDDIETGGQTLRAGMSIGVAVYPVDGETAQVILANADAALYRAKAEARGSVRFFAAEMDKNLRERRALQHDLRMALTRGEMALHYQPQASVGGEIVGFEALARWKHPTRGVVSPGQFIPLAEDSGLIIHLGEWILREACREAASWPKPLQIAVNLSPVQFRHGDLPTLVHTILLETGLAPGRLEIEITEGVLIDDFNRALSILRRLKALGVRIAMDDFGTGYSSLSYLQSFPFDKIKIDQAFVANLDRNPQSAAIIRAVIGLGRGLDLPVVAEGVETREQMTFLTHEACNEVQGYFIGRPAPIERYAELIGRTAPLRALAG